MKTIVAFLVIFVAYCQAVSYEALILQQWDNFKLEHRKSYESQQDEHYRLGIFLDNLHKNIKHNNLYAKGLSSYTRGINQFSDLTEEEFLKKYTIDLSKIGNLSNIQRWGVDTRKEDFIFHARPSRINKHDLADEKDWRAAGYVTPVKNQGQCGSCWTFSATGALEGQWFASKKQLVELSEQNLLDCSSSYGNHGCNGGWMPSAFQYIIDNGGIDTESSYGYETQEGSCRYQKENNGATVSSIVYVATGEDNLKSTLNTVGPIAVAIEVIGSFMEYSGGVYDDPNCGSSLNHAVLAVGYGTDPTYGDFWLIKNSWGTGWGDQGYIKMARNKNDQCGISQAASYPVV